MARFLFVLETAPCGLLYGRGAGGQASGATGNFGYARGMPEGRGKFSLRRERRPQSAGRERQQGRLRVSEKRGADTAYVFTHARVLEQCPRSLGLRRLLLSLIPDWLGRGFTEQ